MMKRSRDYLAGDDTSPSERRGWRVIHQSLVITQINIKSRSLMAFVDLRVKPLDRNLKGRSYQTSSYIYIYNVDNNTIDTLHNSGTVSNLLSENKIKREKF